MPSPVVIVLGTDREPISMIWTTLIADRGFWMISVVELTRVKIDLILKPGHIDPEALDHIPHPNVNIYLYYLFMKIFTVHPRNMPYTSAEFTIQLHLFG
ncbi:hypothetical protein WG66_010606 [Moniliophthora roreri]|nr:hypothetical protein WG66_010606 [Moniliophthora roreri]